MSASDRDRNEWAVLVSRQEQERLELDIMQATEMAEATRRLGFDGDLRACQQRAKIARERLDVVVRELRGPDGRDNEVS